MNAETNLPEAFSPEFIAEMEMDLKIALLMAELEAMPAEVEKEVSARSAIAEAYNLSKRGFRSAFAFVDAFVAGFVDGRTGSYTHRAQAYYSAAGKKGSKAAVEAGFAAAGDQKATLRYSNDEARGKVIKKIRALGFRGYLR